MYSTKSDEQDEVEDEYRLASHWGGVAVWELIVVIEVVLRDIAQPILEMVTKLWKTI